LIPEYALENYKKFSSLLSPEDDVIYTTKIHGTNARYVFWDGEMHCGSHKTWKTKPGEKKEQENSTTGEKVEWLTPESSWWNGLQDNPWIEEWCRKNPGITVFGELFGNTVQGNKFHYGCKDGKLGIRIFDVFKDGAWVSFSELLTNPLYEGLKLVPVLYQGKHDRTTLMELAEKWEDSLENCGENHIREGIVIRKVENVKDEHGRRVVLKYVSNNYLMRS
jgi:RNA ligase (TIGR02306 family)